MSESQSDMFIQKPGYVLAKINQDFYYDFIPTWSDNPADNRFKVMGDEVSGRIPVTKIEHWRQIAELLESSFLNRPGVQLIFRGHRRGDWSMLPTLGRLTPTGIVSEDLANTQLSFFKRAVRGRLGDGNLVNDDDELWAVGQHYGLMTPLLDWTYSPYVALFFAFAKPDVEDETDNPYRAIYILNKSFVEDSDLCPGIRLLEPRKDDHGRLVNQAGLFTVSPNDATIENKIVEILSSEDFPDEDLRNADENSEAEILAKYICKVYIKNEAQEECIRHLRKMNVHHASLFPDLIGASEYCNLLTTEWGIDQRLAQAKQEGPISSSQELEENKEVKEEEKITIPVDEYENLEDLLTAALMGSSFDPSRIRIIKEDLIQTIHKNKTTDWQERESVQARIRTATKIVLRKHGYPEQARDAVVERIIDWLLNNSKDSEK